MRDTYSEAKQLLAEIGKIIEQNKDDRKKEIGDKVIMWDYSGCKDKKTGKSYSCLDSIEGQEAIIIETGLKENGFTYFDDKPRILDILIHYPDGTEVYTHSNFVKRTDNFAA